MKVIGVGGCRTGWLAVTWQGPSAEAQVFASVAEIIALDAAFTAIDMPIGFPEHGQPGGRLCDRLARAKLGDRQSSLFSVPVRAAVMSSDYRDACAAQLAASEPPRKIAKQIFHIFPKMRELDKAISPALQSRLAEVHPELAFSVMNGQQPLALPKKVKGRVFPDGMELRRALLEKAGFPLAKLRLPEGRRGWGEDDLLDACACAWSAKRLAEGQGFSLPPDPPCDARGLRMQICA